jgi:hypothetical protein
MKLIDVWLHCKTGFDIVKRKKHQYLNSLDSIKHRLDALFEEFDTDGDSFVAKAELQNDIEAVCKMVTCPEIHWDPSDDEDICGGDDHDEL